MNGRRLATSIFNRVVTNAIVAACLAMATLPPSLAVEPVTAMARLKSNTDYDNQLDDGVINYNRYELHVQ